MDEFLKEVSRDRFLVVSLGADGTTTEVYYKTHCPRMAALWIDAWMEDHHGEILAVVPPAIPA